MRIATSCLIAASVVGVAAGPASAGILDEVLPGRLVVGLTPTADPAVVLTRMGDLALGSRPVPGLNAIVVDVPPESRIEAGRRAAGAGVRYTQPDARMRAGTVPGDPATVGTLETVRMPGAWSWSTGSPETIVAVVDTGVSPTERLPADRLLPGHDFVSGDADAADDDNHGTLVANIIAGADGSGVCGQCRILPVRALSHPDGGNAVNAAAGIVWAVDHGARVVHVSATTSLPSFILREAIEYAERKGVLVVGASGSTGIVQPQYPGQFPTALTASSVDSAGRKNSNTNQNNAFFIDVAAADNLSALDAQGAGRQLAGSPAAAAVVSGTAALAFAAKADATVAEVRAAIVQGAMPSPERSYDPPILDAGAVLSRIKGTDTNAPTVTSTGLTEGQLITGTPVTVRPVVADEHGVARVDLVVNGEVVGTQGTPWAAPMRLAAPAGASGPQPVVIRAYDHAGNVGQDSTTVHFDAVQPEVAIVSPAPGAAVRNPVEVVVATDADVTAVTAAGVPMVRRPGTDTWTAKVSVGAIDGMFSAVARDAAGHTGSASWYGRIDEAGPTATAIKPAHQTRVRGTFTTTLSDVRDAAGVAKAELWSNGRRVGTDTAAPYSLPVKTGTASGNLTLTWKLTDQLGNARSYTRTVIADNKAPTVSITKAPRHKAKVKGTVKISVKATDASGIARVELIVNGKVVARDTTAAYLLGFTVGKRQKTMKVQIRAYDKLGNVAGTSTRTWYRG